MPDLILVPLVGYDNCLNRLGYGGGFYDRTFIRLRRLGHPFVSVAVAYDGQKIKCLHCNKVMRRDSMTKHIKRIHPEFVEKK